LVPAAVPWPFVLLGRLRGRGQDGIEEAHQGRDLPVGHAGQALHRLGHRGTPVQQGQEAPLPLRQQFRQIVHIGEEGAQGHVVQSRQILQHIDARLAFVPFVFGYGGEMKPDAPLHVVEAVVVLAAQFPEAATQAQLPSNSPAVRSQLWSCWFPYTGKRSYSQNGHIVPATGCCVAGSAPRWGAGRPAPRKTGRTPTRRRPAAAAKPPGPPRSEEHTSELQSRENL